MIAHWLHLAAHGLLVLIQPVGLVWCASIWLTLALAGKRRWRPASVGAFMVAVITICGGTDFPGWLLARLERPYAAVKFAELPVCDAIVQLGGAIEPSSREAGGIHFTFAGDRVFMALELVRLGKAPVLCLGGGFGTAGSPLGDESDIVKTAIVERGLAKAEVISLGGSLDTRHEALHVQRLTQDRGWRRVLLVTSAAHMRRAAATFRHHGIEVVPAPCNFLADFEHVQRRRPLRLPTWHGFFDLSVWLHEQVGWLEYRRRGWITPADIRAD